MRHYQKYNCTEQLHGQNSIWVNCMECDKQTSLVPQKITVPGTDRTQKVKDKCFTLKNRFKKAKRTSSSGLITQENLSTCESSYVKMSIHDSKERTRTLVRPRHKRTRTIVRPSKKRTIVLPNFNGQI